MAVKVGALRNLFRRSVCARVLYRMSATEGSCATVLSSKGIRSRVVKSLLSVAHSKLG